MTHPWVMDNNCVKLYPDRTREYKVIAQTRCEQTDRRTDRRTDGQMDGWMDRQGDSLFAGV